MNYFNNTQKNTFTAEIIAKNLEILTKHHENVVFIFVGTDANTGDSLGPLTGTLLNHKSNKICTYGSLDATITAKEVPFVAKFVKKAHPTSFIVVIDAALGKKQDVGQIKVLKEGIQPGLGVNKKLPVIGDAGIIAVIGEKSPHSDAILGTTRLSCVFDMANVIRDGISRFITLKDANNRRYLTPTIKNLPQFNQKD